MATLALEISTGDIWALNGEGKWINQDTVEEYDPDPEEKEVAV